MLDDNNNFCPGCAPRVRYNRIAWCDGSCTHDTPTSKCEVRDQLVATDDIDRLNALIREIVADDMRLLTIELVP